jgi:hypothetical protein
MDVRRKCIGRLTIISLQTTRKGRLQFLILSIYSVTTAAACTLNVKKWAKERSANNADETMILSAFLLLFLGVLRVLRVKA